MMNYSSAKYSSLIILLFFISCKNENKLNEQPIIIEATYMQYACGDWNDDMKINSVSDSTYNFMIGRDIDPLFLNGEDEISEFFFANKTNEFWMEYRMFGYLSEKKISGCEDSVPKFWITKIEKMNGDAFRMAE